LEKLESKRDRYGGVFNLAFAGVGAIIVNAFTNNTITHIGVALTFSGSAYCK